VEEPRIALAASPREWAQRLHRHVADHGGAQVRATVLHPADAIAETYDVFIGDDTTSYLTRRLVDELHRLGRGVLGVFDPDDPRGKGDLLDIGVDEVIVRGASPEEFVASIEAVARRCALTLERVVSTADIDGLATLMEPLTEVPERQTPEIEAGTITVVGAASGGAGATEIAIGLAHACGRRGDTTVLVDVDDVAPALAQRLGQPPYPNIRAAVDALEHRLTRLADVLVPVPDGRFAMLPGLSSPRSWPELRSTEVTDVIGALATIRRHVIVNAGHRVEDLRGMGGPPRHGVTRSAIGMADTVVGVTHPTPVGLARLLEWLAEVRSVTAITSIHIVFNRAPASTFKHAELVAELSRTFTPASVWFVPTDPRVESAAWSGDLVPSGPFTKAVEAAAHTIAPTSTTVRARRRKRARA
jgi:MinD-like ATPase involved in chromosome partitioning or flagellar assembly